MISSLAPAKLGKLSPSSSSALKRFQNDSAWVVPGRALSKQFHCRLMLYRAPCCASKSLNRVAMYWLFWPECTVSPAGCQRTTKAQRLADQVFGHRIAHIPADDFERVPVQPDGQVEPVADLLGQLRDIARPHPVECRRGLLAQQAVRCSSHGRVGVGGTGHK